MSEKRRSLVGIDKRGGRGYKPLDCRRCGTSVYVSKDAESAQCARCTVGPVGGKLLQLHVIQKELLARAMRTGKLREFLRSKLCTENKVTLSDLAKQSNVSMKLWKCWLGGGEAVDGATVNEVVRAIRHYEATEMLEQLRGSEDFSSKNETSQERAIRIAYKEEVLDPIRELPLDQFVVLGQEVEVTQDDGFPPLPAKAFHFALRKGRMKEFVDLTKIKVSQLVKQTHISRTMWAFWIKEGRSISLGEANEIVREFRGKRSNDVEDGWFVRELGKTGRDTRFTIQN